MAYSQPVAYSQPMAQPMAQPMTQPTAYPTAYSQPAAYPMAPMRPRSNNKMMMMVVVAVVVIVIIVVVVVVVSSQTSTEDSSNDSSDDSSDDSGGLSSLYDVGSDSISGKVVQDTSNEIEYITALSPAFDCGLCGGSNCEDNGKQPLEEACKGYYGENALPKKDSSDHWATNEAAGGIAICNGYCKVPTYEFGGSNTSLKLTDIYPCVQCEWSDCANNGESLANSHCKMVYGSDSTAVDNGTHGFGTNKYAGADAAGFTINCSAFCEGGKIQGSSLGGYSAY